MSFHVEHQAAIPPRHRQLSRHSAWVWFAVMVGGFAAFWSLAVTSPETIDRAWSHVRNLPLLAEGAVWVIAFPLVLSLAVWESSWAEWVRILLVTSFTITWSLLFYPKQSRQ